MDKEDKIEQPNLDIQLLVSELMEQEPDDVVVCGKKHRIGWLKRRTVRKFSHIMLKEKDPWKRNVKVCACILLNKRFGVWNHLSMRFLYGFYWRWLYYVRDIDQVEVMGVLDASKKKIQSTPLTVATILATAMMDTTMMMARHERGPAVPSGAAATP